MSAYDDISEGLKKIHDSVYVSGTKRTASYKSGHTNDGEYPRVKAYLDGGAAPSPWPTTLMGQGLSLVERGRRTLAPEPPPVGFPIPTYQAEITEDNYPYKIGNQSWVLATSPTTPSDSWGGAPYFARELRTPMDTGGGGSWEWWAAWQINFVDWNESNQGSINSTPEDWHTTPGQPGWDESDPENWRYVVSPVHFRYRDGSYNLAMEPNYPNHQFPIVAAPLPKGQWYSVLARIVFGRLDGRIPSSGHPNAGKGRAWVAWNGSWVLDTGDVSNLWYSPTSGKFTTKMLVLEGLYCPTSTKRKFQYTLARFGRTRAECLGDSQIDPSPIYPPGEGGTQPIITRIADRSSKDFVEPA